MTVVGNVPGASRAVRWVGWAVVVGVILPSVVAASIALAAYYPVGSFLPPLPIMGLVGAVLGMVATAVALLVSGTILAIKRWNWRPVALAATAVGAMAVGFVPGLWSFAYAKHYAYQLLGQRSETLVKAIERFEQVHGVPPQALIQLTPEFLPSIPDTGMAAYPEYEYAWGAGPCPVNNAWHLKVDAGEVLKWDFFFYCPKKNYTEEGWGGYNEVVGNWAYLHE